MRENRLQVQCNAVNKSYCSKASMIGHEGKHVTGSVQYSTVNECHCGKANMTGHEGK